MSAALIPCVCGSVWSDDDSPAFKAAVWNLQGDIEAAASVSAAHPASPVDVQWCSVRRDAALDAGSAVRWLDVLFDDRCHKVVAALASNLGVDVRRVLMLADHEHFEVRRALWGRADLPSGAYEYLSVEFA